MSAHPYPDPADSWDPLPPSPPGHGPWELVDQRTYHRAWKDDLPVAIVDVVHGDRHQTKYFVAHMNGGAR